MKFLQSFSALIIVRTTLLSLALGPAISISSSRDPKSVNVLAFGDSLTAGYSVPTQKSYPARLQEELLKQGIPVHVTNAGVSGDTSGQGLRRIEWNLKQKPFDVVLLCLGANDGLRHLPLKDSEKNLATLIENFQQKKLRVVLLGMKLPSNFDAQYRKDFEGMYARLAKKYRLDFYPFLLEGVATDQLLNLEDQIHPNEKGYEIVAQRLASFLAPRFKKYFSK